MIPLVPFVASAATAWSCPSSSSGIRSSAKRANRSPSPAHKGIGDGQFEGSSMAIAMRREGGRWRATSSSAPAPAARHAPTATSTCSSSSPSQEPRSGVRDASRSARRPRRSDRPCGAQRPVRGRATSGSRDDGQRRCAQGPCPCRSVIRERKRRFSPARQRAMRGRCAGNLK
jgi:hypothetical protein